jgi:hypothetical protein
MKRIGNTKELEETSIKLLSICNDTSIPTNSWVKSLFMHSEILVMKGEIEEAIQTLKKVYFILPPMPLPQLNYRDKSIRIKNEILDEIKKAVQVNIDDQE